MKKFFYISLFVASLVLTTFLVNAQRGATSQAGRPAKKPFRNPITPYGGYPVGSSPLGRAITNSGGGGGSVTNGDALLLQNNSFFLIQDGGKLLF